MTEVLALRHEEHVHVLVEQTPNDFVEVEAGFWREAFAQQRFEHDRVIDGVREQFPIHFRSASIDQLFQ